MPKILVIDDNRDNLTSITALLRRLIPESAVITAQSSSEGIKMAVAETPDTVLLDFNMPEIDGFETCRRLKADEKTNSIPIIMVTSVKTDTQSRIKGLTMGADAFLSKPFDDYELVAQVKFALRIKEAETALRVQRDSLEVMVQERTEALKTNEAKLARAMELAHLVNWEFDATTGIFTFNDRFYAFHCTTAALEGGYQMPADVYAKEFVHPDEQHLVAEEVNKAIQANDANFQSYLEHRIVRRDGEIRNIVVLFGITKDENGITVKTHGANQDITERKRIEEALTKSEENYRMLFHEMLAGFSRNEIICDLQGHPINSRYLAVNPAFERITGLKAKDVLGKTILDVFPLLDPSWIEIFGRVALTGKPEHFEKEVALSGRWFDVVAFSPEPNQYACTFTDITDRKRAEGEISKQLEELQRWNDVMQGREDRMIELKKEVNELLIRAGQPPRYQSVVPENPTDMPFGPPHIR